MHLSRRQCALYFARGRCYGALSVHFVPYFLAINLYSHQSKLIPDRSCANQAAAGEGRSPDLASALRQRLFLGSSTAAAATGNGLLGTFARA